MNCQVRYSAAVSLLAAVVLGASLVVPARAQTAASADSVKKWFPTTQMHTIAPIVIKGKEFTVRELIQNAMKGERTKLAGHADANYLVSDHAAILWPDKKEVDTQVYRIYADSTGFTRRLLIAAKVEKFKKKDGEWVFEKNADSHDAGYRVSDFDESRFTDIPVYLKQDQEFDFQLLDRTLEKDRVVFHVRFTPKSDFSEMPGGEIWIDGNGFRVVHEIYEFNKNPFPILIKGIRRISVQWQELPGGEWVPRQVAAELDIRKGPFLPSGISFKQTWSDFRFDEGYKEYLFGKREGTPVAIAPKPAASPKVQTAPEAKRALGPPDTARVNTGVSAVVPESLYVYQAAPTDTSAADTTAASVGGGPALLAELQRQDNAAYSPEVEITNHAFIDSTAARHERLGIDAFKGSDIPLYGSHWELSFDPQVERWDYNRVEGLLFGGSAMFGRADKRSALSFFGGYATASRKFRYHTEFSTELPNADRKVSLKLSFRDYIDPFGSNRIPLNSLRAFVGGADDQDYLHRTGGGASLVYTPWEDVSFDAGFEGARERSTATNADFSFWGDLGRPNPVVDEGDEHAIVAGFELGGRRWLNAQITQRLAGGSLGGDFRYARTDIMLRARGFVLGRQEFEATLRGVTTADSPPSQQLADIGGLSTVRGYEPRTHVGDHSFAARLEYLFPYDVLAATHIPLIQELGFQFIPWADAARVGDGDSPDWITSVGFGLQRYLWPAEDAANLRLDFAWPQNNPNDNFAVYLWFTAMH